MLLRLLAAASLVASIGFGVLAYMNFQPFHVALAVNGLIGFAVLIALANIVDSLEVIAKNTAPRV